MGAINWFPTHNTSMSGETKLMRGDNKGYAAYHWEREVEQVDYLAPANTDFISAFAQTNAGDMSPNVDLKPADELPAEEFENSRTIGLRQYQAAHGQLAAKGTRVAGGVDARLTYINLSNVTVRPEFTGDGEEQKATTPSGTRSPTRCSIAPTRTCVSARSRRTSSFRSAR